MRLKNTLFSSTFRLHYAYSLPSALAIVFLAFLAVVASSTILYVYTLETVESDIHEYLSGIGRAGARSIDGDLHATFTSRKQETSPEYLNEVKKLGEVLMLFPSVKYIYTCILKDGKVYFILDPTPPGMHTPQGVDEKAHIMDEYTEAEADLITALTQRKPVFNKKPYQDRWGSFVSGYIPFYNSKQEFVGVIGVDLNAQDYSNRLHKVYRTAMICIIIGFFISCSIGALLYRQDRRIRAITGRLERTNRELTILAEAAKRATQEKSLFLANITHDLRTPMSGILGMAYLLRDTKLDPTQKEYIDTINHSAENLLLLINDVLDMSKIEAGELIVENAPFDMKDCFSKSINILKPLAQNKNIGLVSRVDNAIPDSLMGDARRFAQIITNLVGNAIKFTDQGKVSVSLQYDATSKLVHCSVEDSGIGIPESKREAIFEKFVQGDVSITQKYGGTGLGLAITKQIVQLLGGSIGFQSQENVGSTFWFTLPALLPAAQQETLDGITVCHVASNRIAVQDARVLIADDHPVNRMFLRRLLVKFGFADIAEAENGKEVIAKLSRRYDVIFMDCKMPEQDGYETTRLIREMEAKAGKGAHMLIIALTANAMLGDRESCLRVGMDEYLTKPIQPDALKMLLAQWFIFPSTKDRAHITASIPSDHTPPIDYARMELIYQTVPEQRELLALFFRLSEQHIAEMQSSRRNEEFKSWREAAHSLKGASANLGMNRLEDICRQAEQGKNLSYNERTALIALAAAEMGRLRQYVRDTRPELLEEA